MPGNAAIEVYGAYEMFGYYAQYTALGNLMGLQANGQMMLMAGMGTFGYEPKVNRLFGFPRSISPGGVALDIPIAGAQITDGIDPEVTARFNQQIGLLSSALEHATPEQMFSTDEQPADAISAVKALSKANAEGQRIYELTPDNMVETLPNLNLAIETEAEIQTALNAGLTVIAHTDNVSVPGWMGAGYIIFDPETGGGAYKISGGANGGFLAFVLAIAQVLAILFISTPLLAGIASGLSLLGFLILAVSVFDDLEASVDVAILRFLGTALALVLFITLGQFVFISFPLLFVMSVILSAVTAIVQLIRLLASDFSRVSASN